MSGFMLKLKNLFHIHKWVAVSSDSGELKLVDANGVPSVVFVTITTYQCSKCGSMKTQAHRNFFL